MAEGPQGLCRVASPEHGDEGGREEASRSRRRTRTRQLFPLVPFAIDSRQSNNGDERAVAAMGRGRESWEKRASQAMEIRQRGRKKQRGEETRGRTKKGTGRPSESGGGEESELKRRVVGGASDAGAVREWDLGARYPQLSHRQSLHLLLMARRVLGPSTIPWRASRDLCHGYTRRTNNPTPLQLFRTYLPTYEAGRYLGSICR